MNEAMKDMFKTLGNGAIGVVLGALTFGFADLVVLALTGSGIANGREALLCCFIFSYAHLICEHYPAFKCSDDDDDESCND